MNFSHLLLIRILTKPYKAWHAHYFPIPPKKIESGKAFTGIAALCAIASTQSHTVGGRLTRGKHCCLTILPKRLKVHSRSIQNKIYSSTFNCTRLRLFVGSHPFPQNGVQLSEHGPLGITRSHLSHWLRPDIQVGFYQKPRIDKWSNSFQTARNLKETNLIIFYSNGRRGSRQLAVKDFGVIKEDEEHSEVILSFFGFGYFAYIFWANSNCWALFLAMSSWSLWGDQRGRGTFGGDSLLLGCQKWLDVFPPPQITQNSLDGPIRLLKVILLSFLPEVLQSLVTNIILKDKLMELGENMFHHNILYGK